MTMTRLPGNGFYYPAIQPALGDYGYTSPVIDATGEKLAVIGNIWWPTDDDTFEIQRAGLRFGTVTKAGGSVLTFSLQAVSTSTSAAQPVDIQDQSVTIPNADITTAGFLRTNALNSNRIVSRGDLFAAVLEFDPAGRLGSDSFVWSNTTPHLLTSPTLPLTTLRSSGGTYTSQTGAASLVFENPTGGFATFEGLFPSSALSGAASFNSSSLADECGNQFTVPFDCKVSGIWAFISSLHTADYSHNIYLNGTLLISVTIDAVQQGFTNNRFQFIALPEEITLYAGQTYQQTVKALDTVGLTLSTATVADANHFTLYPGGTNFQQVTRKLSTSAVFTTSSVTRRALGLRLSAVDFNPQYLVLYNP